jgi:hexokinase
LGEILDWSEEDQQGDVDPISLCSAEDGSGVGVAVIAALTIERSARGDMVGIKGGGDSSGG